MENLNRNNLSQYEWDIEVLATTNPLFKSSYECLSLKYNKYELIVSETLKEIQMFSTDFYIKKKKGIETMGLTK